jgi:flagellar motor switch protein FliM
VERILSKDEIAELLSAVRAGDVVVEGELSAAGGGPKVNTLDLVFSHNSRKCKFENFDIVLDTFARNYSISLTNCLQHSILVQREAIEAYEFEGFLQRLSGHEAIGIISLEPLRWGGLLIFSDALSLYLVEKLLGGNADAQQTLPDRPLSAIERSVLRRSFDDACLDLAKAFLPLEKLDSSLVKIEGNPRLVNIVPPDTQVVVCRFTVSIGEWSGKISLAIPLPALEPLREKMRDQMGPLNKKTDQGWKQKFEDALTDMETDIAAQLAQIALPVRDILNFQIGDIIDLGQDPSGPLSVLVEGKPKFIARAGVFKGKKAVRLTERIKSQINSQSKD